VVVSAASAASTRLRRRTTSSEIVEEATMAAVGIHARLRRWSNCASSDQSPGPMSVSRHCTRQPSPHPRHPGFGTDDEHRRHGRQLLAQPDAVGLGAQHPLVLVGSAQPAGPSAGGDHQPVVGHGPGGGCARSACRGRVPSPAPSDGGRPRRPGARGRCRRSTRCRRAPPSTGARGCTAARPRR